MTPGRNRLRMATSRICSIDDCGKSHEAKGFCKAHYERLRRHGDPLGGRTPDGEPIEFYQSVVLTHEGADCLLWPYTRCTNGYGQMVKNGRLGTVSRILCEDIHGPPPTPEHEAAHSCGNGMSGCVTKRHLSWKTPKENQNDRILHATHSRGERCVTAKLTEVQVREIVALKGHLSQRKIAEKFGVHQVNVGRIHAGTSWGWLKYNDATHSKIKSEDTP